MITALRDGLHGLHIARMALVAESKALRLDGRKAEREKVWARVEEITAQIEVTNRELSDHMLREEDAAARWVELMPCPFCGLTPGGFDKVQDGGYIIGCHCGANGPVAESEEDARDGWNQRKAYLPDDRRSGE